jgi:8-oxo-dGTP diphosphatase
VLIHVAVGIITNERNEVLIAERPSGKSYNGFWEFPGGKVEKNETILQALQRELLEELGIQLITAEAWLEFNYTYPDRAICLHTWRVTQFTGEPRGVESQRIQWASLDQLDQFQFLPGNVDILKQL